MFWLDCFQMLSTTTGFCNVLCCFQMLSMGVVMFCVVCFQMLSRDSVTVTVDAVVYYRVHNPTIAVSNVENFR